MKYKTFINADQLFEIHTKSNIVIFDIRFGDETQGSRNLIYLEAHIPGAIYADFKYEITGDENAGKGRNPLPKISDFKNWLEKNNLNPADSNLQIVIYDNNKGSNAARVWWQLRTMNFHSVAVLEGGYDQWIRKNFPIINGEELRKKSEKSTIIPPTWEEGIFPFVEINEIKKNIETQNKIVIDSRDADRYNGVTTGIDPIAGHIPKSKLYHWASNVNEQGLLKSKETIKLQLNNVTKFQDINNIIFSCGSGVTACYNILVSEHVGLGIPALYVGSWSEWSYHNPDLTEP
ncbi:MAG: 3-mercaptopyruvate sulfurtransferase [Candidatus Heimdallarchaeota archaeon LC_3]|nr:MAG: 3-mercaptopyruvate sulfurtransferase [Candidatus Heimdallarchaeota archaeon LC_3]